MRVTRIRRLVAAAALASLPATLFGQQQVPRTRADFPCGARIDPSYFNLAEGTGGQLLLLAPGEIGDSARLLTAFDGHGDTIFRLAGTLNAGLHEFRIPIDSSVESVVFSISVQCLETAEVLGPSATPVAGDNVTDISNYRAIRMITVTQPEPGTWTVRTSGSGIAGVVVQARSALRLSDVEVNRNAVRFSLDGEVDQLQASLVNGAFKRIAALSLAPSQAEGAFVASVQPPSQGFRLVVTGRDARGFPFQRTTAALLTARP